MEKNLFENVEIVSVNDPTINQDDLVYISDEEEIRTEITTTTIQIALHEETKSLSEEDENNPMHVKLEKIESESESEYEGDGDTVVDESEQHIELNISTPSPQPPQDILESEVILKYEPPEMEISPEDYPQSFEEQFELIDMNNSSQEDNLNESVSSSEVSAVSEHDHPYSQLNVSKTTFCDDVVQNILKESDLNNNAKAISLLTNFTNYIEHFVSLDDQTSQLSLYLKQMKLSLEGKASEIVEEENNGENQAARVLVPSSNSFESVHESKNENLPHYSIPATDENDENADISKAEQGESSVQIQQNEVCQEDEFVEMKHEPMEVDPASSNQNNDDDNHAEHMEESLDLSEDVSSLKKQITGALSMAEEFNKYIRDLGEHVCVNKDDVENAKQKLGKSVFQLLEKSYSLLSDIAGADSIDDKFSIFRSETVKIPNAAQNNDNEDSESELDENKIHDDEVDKLLDFNSLLKTRGEVQPREREERQSGDNQPAKTKSQKIKQDKSKKNDDDLDLSSSDESIVTNFSTSDIEKEKPTESDEEAKMIQRNEENVRLNLLGDSSESDDSESENSSFLSFKLSSSEDDSKEKSTKKKRLKKTKSNSSEKDSDSETDRKAEKSPVKTESAASEKTENYDVDVSDEEEKVKKRKKLTGFEAEIFSKKFLELDNEESTTTSMVKAEKTSQENARSQRSNSMSQKSKPSDNNAENENVVDLSVFEKRSEKKSSEFDLPKYFEKRENSQISANNAQSESERKPPPPSPSVDDDIVSISSESDSEVSSTNAEGQPRRRKQLTEEELKEETKKAKNEEKERLSRLTKKNDSLTQYLTQRASQSLSQDDDVIPPTELILDYSEKKKLEITVHPKLVDRLKPHQVDGVKFMYDNCYGPLDHVKENGGSGCILAHCMGLGKTLQLITLLHTVIRYKDLYTKRILVICPKSTIFNWYEEIKKWLNDIKCIKFIVRYLEDNIKIDKRVETLEDWFESEHPGVFLINYEAFRTLVHWSGTSKRSKIPMAEHIVKKLQGKITKCLLDPGPNLVVCDEGHLIKNQKGATNKAITKITTKRRIILTGTPVQNNLSEYYAMVQWIKPNFLGTINEFNNIYATPIKDGQNKDSTPAAIKKMKQKSFILNNILSKFVQRKEASVLKEFLPQKYEYVLSVPLTDLQEKLYEQFLKENPCLSGRSLLPDYTALRKIWTHPRVLQYAYERAMKGENKFNVQQQQQQLQQKKAAKNFIEEGEDENPDDVYDTSQGTTAVTNNWWSNLVSNHELLSLKSSYKMMLLFEILKKCEERGEKILIFTAFVAVLDVIELFMKAIHEQETNPLAQLYGYDQFKTSWKEGLDYFRLDGSTPRMMRHRMIQEFNKPNNNRLRCFLISAKAGGQGINLIGANRCIIVDTSWNPANDQQNIFRIYRLGQKRACFIYRIVALGTMEEKVYSRSVTKQAMSGRVVDKQQIDRHYRFAELNELYTLTKYHATERPTPNVPKDNMLAQLLHTFPKAIYKFHEHDSLLENKPDEDLSEAEKKEAWDVFELESKLNTGRLNPPPQMLNNPAVFANNDLMNTLRSDMYGYMGMMPSTSGTAPSLDPKSYYQMAQSYYTHELYKKLQSSFDLNALNIYGSSPPPIASSLPSILRNQLNPISALGSMTSSALFNNNIPDPASYVAPKVSTPSSTSSITTGNIMSKLKANTSLLLSNQANALSRNEPESLPTFYKNRLSGKYIKPPNLTDPLAPTTKESVPQKSIFPEVTIPKKSTQINGSSLSKVQKSSTSVSDPLESTSARTSFPVSVRKSVPSSNVNKITAKKTADLMQNPKYIQMRNNNKLMNVSGLVKNVQNRVSNSGSASQNNNNNQRQVISSPGASQKSNGSDKSQQSLASVPSTSQTAQLKPISLTKAKSIVLGQGGSKPTPSRVTPNAVAAVVTRTPSQGMKKPSGQVIDQNRIMQQLKKNDTSMIDTSAKKIPDVLQQSALNSSISIIKLPQQPNTTPTKPLPVPSVSVQQKVIQKTPGTTKVQLPQKVIISPQQFSQMQRKRPLETVKINSPNMLSQTKRIKITDNNPAFSAHLSQIRSQAGISNSNKNMQRSQNPQASQGVVQKSDIVEIE